MKKDIVMHANGRMKKLNWDIRLNELKNILHNKEKKEFMIVLFLSAVVKMELMLLIN